MFKRSLTTDNSIIVNLNLEILRDTTMADNWIYMPNYNKVTPSVDQNFRATK